MLEPIPFRGVVRALGETFSASAVSAGSARAESLGIDRGRVVSLGGRDRRLAKYFLGLLGSIDMQDQRCGEIGLRRLLGGSDQPARYAAAMAAGGEQTLAIAAELARRTAAGDNRIGRP